MACYFAITSYTTLHYIKEYFVDGLQRGGPARHYKCHEENKRNKS